jgi:hypothetical protein
MPTDAEIMTVIEGLYGLVLDTHYSAAFVSAHRPIAESRAHVSVFGIYYTQALAMLLAHQVVRLDPLGALNSGGVTAPPGGVSSITTGRQSVVYRAPKGAAMGMPFSEAALANTKPGQDFLALLDSRTHTLPMVVTL